MKRANRLIVSYKLFLLYQNGSFLSLSKNINFSKEFWNVCKLILITISNISFKVGLELILLHVDDKIKHMFFKKSTRHIQLFA